MLVSEHSSPRVGIHPQAKLTEYWHLVLHLTLQNHAFNIGYFIFSFTSRSYSRCLSFIIRRLQFLDFDTFDSRSLKKSHAAPYTEFLSPFNLPYCPMNIEYALLLQPSSLWNSPTLNSLEPIKERILRLWGGQMDIVGVDFSCLINEKKNGDQADRQVRKEVIIR
jgi:hypothetical protein